MTLGCVWAILLHRCGAGPGIPDPARTRSCRARPTRWCARASTISAMCSASGRTGGRKWGRASPGTCRPTYFVERAARSAAAVRRRSRSTGCAEADRQDHRRVLPADRRRRSQLQHPPLARGGGRRGLSGGHRDLARLPDALVRAAIRGSHRHRPLRATQRCLGPRPAAAASAGPIDRMRARAWRHPARDCRISTSCAASPRPTSTAGCRGGEGDMLVGKALWAHHHKKAHMICELSPYACMPNTMSIGAMAGVRRQASRPALRAARDQGRRRGACAVALPDDPDRSQEARAEGVRRGAANAPG